MKIVYQLIAIGLIMAFSLQSYSQTPSQRQKARPKGTTGFMFGYYEYLPANYNSATDLPIVLFFHGIGEKGDGTTELHKVLRNGPPKLVNLDKDFPFILISPQHTTGWWNGTEVNSLIQHVKANYKVDADRIYVTGLSAGGYGTWTAGAAAASQIAAIVPISGGGSSATATNMKALPVRAFHNVNDPVVYSINSINLVNAVRSAGGSATLSVFPSSAHDAWSRVYNDQNMWDWLLSQKRGVPAVTTPAKPPVVYAGEDRVITLPQNSTSITATASDSDGTIVSHHWLKVSGPSVTMSYTNTSTVRLSSLVAGTYMFRVSVIDNTGWAGYDNIKITVNPEPTLTTLLNVDAGADKVISLPANSVSISATCSAPAGSYTSQWTKVTGHSITITNANQTTANLSNLVAGTYVFRITVSDNSGSSVSDDVQVIVNPSSNILPVVNAGADKVLTLPTNATTLSASCSDSDGSITYTLWTKVSGPTATMTNYSQRTMSLSNLVAGVYLFKITVKDNTGGTAYDEVKVTVNSGQNSLPMVDAGKDQELLLPTNSLNLTATASDQDGSIASYLWTQIAGPTVTMSNENQPTLSLSNLVCGTYVFRITVKDNSGAIVYDEITVTVKPDQNILPAVDAGVDRVITLPTNTLTLSASCSDKDGSITYTLWTKVSGPAVTMTNFSQRTMYLSNLVQGTYVFRITVKDNLKGTVSDEVMVTVNPVPNILPTVNAGLDKVVTLPTNTLTLSASCADKDGSVTYTLWTKVSGPAVTMTNYSQRTMYLSNLVEGTYLFRITVKDNSGGKVFDEVMVTVKSATTARIGVSEENLTNSTRTNLYPNPAYEKININVEHYIGKNLEVDVLDGKGKVVLGKRLFNENGLISFDVSAIMEGIYFLRILSGDHSEMIKFVKK